MTKSQMLSRRNFIRTTGLALSAGALSLETALLDAIEIGTELTVMRTQRCNFDVERG